MKMKMKMMMMMMKKMKMMLKKILQKNKLVMSKKDEKMKKKIIESSAPAGKVTIQDTTIFLTMPKFSAETPRAKPTPNTAPTNVCVVEIGRPVPDAITTVQAAASSAAKPRLGVK